MNKKLSQRRLRILNVIAGFLHLFQGIAVIFLSKDFTLPITGNYLSFNTATQALEPTSTVLFELSVPALIVAFLLLSAVAHFSIATFYHSRYVAQLARGINVARWIEYSFSASIMIVAVALLVGVYDAMSLVMLFGLVAIMNLLGLVMELHNQNSKKPQWISYWIGCLAGIIPWIVIAFYLWIGADNGSSAPTFVYWIFVSIFLFFNCFAINMVLQYKKIGHWKDYIYGERSYILLSLIAKSLLAWQVFAGTLRP